MTYLLVGIIITLASRSISATILFMLARLLPRGCLDRTEEVIRRLFCSPYLVSWYVEISKIQRTLPHCIMFSKRFFVNTVAYLVRRPPRNPLEHWFRRILGRIHSRISSAESAYFDLPSSAVKHFLRSKILSLDSSGHARRLHICTRKTQIRTRLQYYSNPASRWTLWQDDYLLPKELLKHGSTEPRGICQVSGDWLDFAYFDIPWTWYARLEPAEWFRVCIYRGHLFVIIAGAGFDFIDMTWNIFPPFWVSQSLVVSQCSTCSYAFPCPHFPKLEVYYNWSGLRLWEWVIAKRLDLNDNWPTMIFTSTENDDLLETIEMM
jgi:hypothetical protein